MATALALEQSSVKLGITKQSVKEEDTQQQTNTVCGLLCKSTVPPKHENVFVWVNFLAIKKLLIKGHGIHFTSNLLLSTSIYCKQINFSK